MNLPDTINILVAEDDQFLAKAYKLKLTNDGFNVKVVSNGTELFKEIDNFKPNIILLDLIMPDMDGFTALAKLKSDEKYKTIPVIVASNLGQSEDIKKAQELGAVDYIIKSDLSMRNLVTLVNQYL